MSFSVREVVTIFLVLLALAFASLPVRAADNVMLDLDLESLMQIQITSAGRKAQNLADVPAAVYVITQEDIHNSGVTSIPEALRMVPGIQVYRIGSSKWAIASRGFNGTFSTKLLVQIDGRSVYSPAYSGVYWDVQNVMLDDVDRIEVIRGPGATLWGANAVNGVINIITKQSSDTQGLLVSVGSGNHERALASLRYGTQFSNNIYGRFFIQHHQRDKFQYSADHTDSYDDWTVTNGGFRLDGDVDLNDSWTFQGDAYTGEEKQQISPYWTEASPFPSIANDEIDTRGYNLLGRWQHNFSEMNSWRLQFYYDYTDRDEIYIGQTHRTLDLDFQHRFQPLERHDIVWGFGYRRIDDEFDNSYMAQILPDSRSKNLFSGFVQDEISVFKDKMWLTLGTKLERNAFTGTEVQPSARLMWKPIQQHSFWASVSKAVRTPSRVEDTGEVIAGKIPLPPTYTTAHTLVIYGNTEMKAEEVIAYEAGYRFINGQAFSLDLVLFYNEYQNLSDYTYNFSPMLLGLPMSILFDNGMEGSTQGLEASIAWQPRPWLTTELNYTYIKLDLQPLNTLNPSDTAIIAEESSPEHQVSLRTGIDIRKNLHLNLWARYVGALDIASNVAYTSGMIVDDYLAFDANISWKMRENIELTLVGQNLFDSSHLEFVNEYFTPPIEIERSVYAKITWNF
jgi:iron complex outermembrane receptor protein